MFIIYNLLLLLLSPLAVLYIVWELVIHDRSHRGVGERLGGIPLSKLQGQGPRLWLQAASVGETVAARPIWEALLAELPGWTLFYSTTTDAGQAQAAKSSSDRARLLYFPFDFLPCVWLALRRVRPDLIVMVETELWPNYLAVARLFGCKVMVVNGRISTRSLAGARRLPWLYRWMTGNIDRFCMQTEGDRERIIQLGADPSRVTVVGNSKFDETFTPVSLGEQVTLRNALGLQRDEPLVLAGSTHQGEEEIVLRAFRHLKTANPTVRLVIAPRDINRAQKVEELAIAHGFAVTRRTRIASVPTPPDAIIILDTIGELARAYALCSSAFVGGSLLDLTRQGIGGHNVLEPLALGKPVIYGPHMLNFRDIAAMVLEEGIGFQVETADELAACWQRFLQDPRQGREVAKRAKKFFAAQAGASQQCAREAAELVLGRVVSSVSEPKSR